MTIRLVKRRGKPLSPAGKLAKSLGVDLRRVQRSGLERDVSPLVRKILMKRLTGEKKA